MDHPTRQVFTNTARATFADGSAKLGLVSGTLSGALVLLIAGLLVPSVRYQISSPIFFFWFFLPWANIAAAGGAVAGMACAVLVVRHAHARLPFPRQKETTAAISGVFGGGVVATLLAYYLPFLSWYSTMYLSR